MNKQLGNVVEFNDNINDVEQEIKTPCTPKSKEEQLLDYLLNMNKGSEVALVMGDI